MVTQVSIPNLTQCERRVELLNISRKLRVDYSSWLINLHAVTGLLFAMLGGSALAAAEVNLAPLLIFGSGAAAYAAKAAHGIYQRAKLSKQLRVKVVEARMDGMTEEDIRDLTI